MASTTLSVFALALASLSFSVSGQAVKPLRCYYCETRDTKACEDPMDPTVVTAIDCSSLDQTASRRAAFNVSEVLSHPVDGKFKAGPIIDEIFQRNGAPEFKYVCLKATFTKDDLKGMSRECGKVPSNVKDPCDFIKQELDPRITLHGCYSCETDRCNSASFLIVSGTTVFCSIFFVMLRTRLQ